MNKIYRALGLFTSSAVLLFTLSMLPHSRISATEFAFITTTDYETGSSSVIWLDGSFTCENDVASVYSDAESRYYAGLIYVVNHLGGDNIQILDPSDGFSTLRQFSVGNGTNPKDIAFLTGTKAYITRYETNGLLISDPTTGSELGTIDLSSLADADGLCEMDRMFLLGDRLFVTIQRMDRDTWLPVGDSYIAVIDCATDTLIDVDEVTEGRQSILLAGSNPFSDLQLDPSSNRLYVSCIGWWGVADCGVEIINPYTCQTEGYILTETAAGGDINDVEILSEDKGYAIITNSSWLTELISFDPSTGSRTGTLYSPGGYVLNDIEISPCGYLFAADQTATNPGVWIYDTNTDTLVFPFPIDTGLPPFDICFSIPAVTEAQIPPLAALWQNYPNPFNPVTTIGFTVSFETNASLAVYDVSGRLVKILSWGSFLPGTYEFEWDGRNDNGGPAASGVYLYRLETGNGVTTKKCVLIR